MSQIKSSSKRTRGKSCSAVSPFSELQKRRLPLRVFCMKNDGPSRPIYSNPALFSFLNSWRTWNTPGCSGTATSSFTALREIRTPICLSSSRPRRPLTICAKKHLECGSVFWSHPPSCRLAEGCAGQGLAVGNVPG